MMIKDELKRERERHGLTQAQVAAKLSVRRQTVSSWETGRSFPDIPTLVKISDLYQVSLDLLLKNDVRYMNQVKADYQKLHDVKQASLQRWTAAFFIFTILPVVFIPLTKTDWQTGVLGAIVLLSSIILCVLAYFLLKNSVTAQNKHAIFIPKQYGFGITINPNSLVGKLLWLIIIIVLVITLGMTIFHLLELSN